MIYSHKFLIQLIFTISISIFVINISKFDFKSIFGMFIGLLICWYLIDRKISIKLNNKADNIINKNNILELLKDDIKLLKFYNKNKTFNDYDPVNFNNSIRNAISSVKVYKRILNDTHLPWYQYDIYIKHYNQCIRYFQNVEFSIPNQKNIRKEINKQLNILISILDKYKNEILIFLKKNKNYNTTIKHTLNKPLPYNFSE